MENLPTHQIPYEQIENGALILYLLRECKTWEELCGRFQYTSPPDIEMNTAVMMIHQKLVELRALGLLSFEEQIVNGKKTITGPKTN
jgi:hypothetical protein